MATPEADREEPNVDDDLKYRRSKMAELRHILGNIFVFALFSFEEDSPEKAPERQEIRKNFIDRLEKAKQRPDYSRVTEEVLADLIARCQTADWNNREALMELKAYIKQFTIK